MTPAEWTGLTLVAIFAVGPLAVLFIGAVRVVMILEDDERSEGMRYER